MEQILGHPEGPVAIAPSTWWLGRRLGHLLERNIYLRVFRKGNKAVNLLIDPGPPEDLPLLNERLQALIGGINQVHLIFLNHQDPDVAHNSSAVQRTNPHAFVICSEDTWRLAQLYGLDPRYYKAVEHFRDSSITLVTGDRITFVPSPFCHFRGAVMLYDQQTRVLFTGDLFGGLSYGGQELYGHEGSWEGIKAFHQIYMPQRQALEHAVAKIRALPTPPVLLAPQHGSLLADQTIIGTIMERLESLPVGLDLVLRGKDKGLYVAALNELLREMRALLGEEEVQAALHAMAADPSFPSILLMEEGGVRDIKIDPASALERALASLAEIVPPDRQDDFQLAALRVLLAWNIPLPASLAPEASTPDFLLPDPTPPSLHTLKGLPLLGGRFSLANEIGVGSMGKVFEAWDQQLEEWVALKILKRDLVSMPDMERFFKREVKAGRQIAHPHVVRLYELGEIEDTLFLTMELLKGGNLAERIAAGLDSDQGLPIAMAITEGLAAIHRAGVIHRDLKPENILFDQAGSPKIGDFGIARFMGDAHKTQGVMGTPAYMSPEQIRGQTLTEQSDIFSLGLLFYEIFTATLPVRGEVMAVLARLGDSRPLAEPRTVRHDLSPALNKLICKMIDKSTARRFASAEVVLEGLRQITLSGSRGRGFFDWLKGRG